MNVFGFCSALCDVVSAPALVCDGEGYVIRINRHARLLLRSYPEAVEGATWATVLSSLRPQSPLQAVAGATEPSACTPLQTVGLVRSPTGATSPCRITVIPVPGASTRTTIVLLSEPACDEAATDPLLSALAELDRLAWLSSAARGHSGKLSAPCSPCAPGAAETGRAVPCATTPPQPPDHEPGNTDPEPSDLSYTPPNRMVFRRTIEPGFPIVMLNGDCEAVTGYLARDLLPGGGRSYARLIAAESRPVLAEDLRAALEGRPLSTTYQILTPDGMAKWVHEQGWIARDPEGKPAAIEGIITDMSIPAEAEERIRSSRDLYQSLFRAVPAGVIVEGGDGCIFDANDGACEILQVPRRAMLGREPHSSLWECVDEQERPVAREDLPSVRARLRGESVRGVVLGLRHQTCRDRRWLLLNAEPLPPASPGGRPRAIVAFTDITAQREALRALERSQSLA